MFHVQLQSGPQIAVVGRKSTQVEVGRDLPRPADLLIMEIFDSILIGDPTWQLVRDIVDCEPQGTVACKGVHFAVAVYTPRPERKSS